MESREAQISAVAELDESTHRQWYNYVLRQPEPVSRDAAAAALGLPRSTAGLHHDRLGETARTGVRLGALLTDEPHPDANVIMD